MQELKRVLANECLWLRSESVKVLKEIVLRKLDQEKCTMPAKDADIIASVKVLNDMHGYNAPIEQNINVYGQHTINKQYVSVSDVDEG